MQSIKARGLTQLLFSLNLLVSWVLLLTTLVLSAVSLASAQPVELNRHSRAYLNDLEVEDRTQLLTSVRENVRNRSRRRDHRSTPQHHFYKAVFIDLLLNPALSYQLSATDRELIETLPSHSDPQFSLPADRTLRRACGVISRSSLQSNGGINGAIQAFEQAQNRIASQLDAHYRRVFNKLSAEGRRVVEEQVYRIQENGSLQYGDIDFQELSFIDSKFVLAFLKDTCENHERRPAQSDSESRTIRQQMSKDFEEGAVQVFQPQ